MGSLTQGSVTGYRYYFSILMGICRGPIDQLFQITAGGKVAWDGSTNSAPLVSNTQPKTDDSINSQEGDPSSQYIGGGSWAGGPASGTSLNVPILASQLFGGDSSEGGILGSFDLYMGDADQTLGSRIKYIMRGLNLSAMRGTTNVFYDGEICANNPYPKQWAFRVRRAIAGWFDNSPWYPERAVIKLTDPAIPAYNFSYEDGVGNTRTYTSNSGTTTTVVTSTYGVQTVTTYTAGVGDVTTTAVPQAYNDIYAMNPAHIIYECCTNPDWGRGLDASLIDQISFSSAANTLYSENFGLCIAWTKQQGIDEFIQTVIDHICAALYTDPTSGLLCLRLLRDDYNASSLPEFGYDTGLLEIQTSESGAPDTTANEIVVTYYSPVLATNKMARAQDIASINSLGDIYSQSKSYLGIPTSTLAVLVAQRDLKIYSAGIKRVTAKLDRRAYQVVPGDVIKITAPRAGLNATILRVATIEEADASDGSIKITGAQDVYGMPTVPFTVQPQSTFLTPNLMPQPITVFPPVEASYRDMYLANPEGGVQNLSNHQSYMMMMAVAPTANCLDYIYQAVLPGYIALSPPTSGWEDIGVNSFVLCGDLVSNVGVTDTVIRVTNSTLDMRFTGKICLIAGESEDFHVATSEYIRLDGMTLVDLDTNTYDLTVGRGCVDTPAITHTSSNIHVYSWDTNSPNQPYLVMPDGGVDGIICWVRGLPRTTQAQLDASQLPTGYGSQGEGLNRFARPYSIVGLRINGFATDQLSGEYMGPADIVFTWKNRNRVTQQDQAVSEDEANITPEVGYYVTVSAIGITPTGGSTLMSAINLGTATTWSFTAALAAENNFGDGPIHFNFTTYRTDAGDTTLWSAFSLAYDNVTVNYSSTTGWGSKWGADWGGG